MPSNLRQNATDTVSELHEILFRAIDHFSQVLPAQASIRDFVHHNTLHGYQDLKFQDALKASFDQTGAYAYWPQEKFRQAYLTGRMTDNDIFNILSKDKSLEANKPIFDVKRGKIYLRDVYKIACLYPLDKITHNQLVWQIEEAHALTVFQSDVPETSRNLLLSSSNMDESEAITALWKACINALDLNLSLIHPEDLINLETEQVNKIFSSSLEPLISLNASSDKKTDIDTVIQKQARKQMDALLLKVGSKITMGGLLKKITGIDIHSEIMSHLLPYLANWLDEGFAKWHPDSKIADSFYLNWKQNAVIDQTGIFSDIPDWKEHINSLPNSAIDTVVAELRRMSIPINKWGDYITRLALELPGWSGMFYWRHRRPDYPTATEMNANIMDYLAVRLVLEHIFVRKYCRRYWLVGGNLATLSGYLHQHYAEFFTRNALFNQELPEYLKLQAQQLAAHNARRDALTMHQKEWRQLAHKIWTWQQSPVADISSAIQTKASNYRAAHYHHDAWKLFRLAQHLGLCAKEIQALDKEQLDWLFKAIHCMDKHAAGFILLQAYELNYQNQLFSAIQQNHSRGTWKNRVKQTPEAQVFFCMDDREEGIRRHLEHINPQIETLGAAAFFNIVLGWKALESDKTVSLCPVVLTPVHEVRETPDPNHQNLVKKYKQRHNLFTKLRSLLHQKLHQDLLTTLVTMTILAPAMFLTLFGKTFFPLNWNEKITEWIKTFQGEKRTRIKTTATEEKQEASIDDRQQGFTIKEQTDIVEQFLQDNGLLSGFAPLIAIIGHYSRNQNNPHTAAYGCGACGGKFSGPNARVFASMANHPDVRKQLKKRGIQIPQKTWFIGAEHDTCNEHIQFYDKDLVPKSLQSEFSKLNSALNKACQHSAHERCRKLASAPENPSLITAIKHIAGRAVDFSQARPELGHATIAAGFVGRRHFSQGIFMDRRSFLISYDASVDPEGIFLERLLLSVGPVGAGINLEYYFSSVNNEYFGSGSKIVHNLSGTLGVIEGASGDLRTGLPVQMIEIHEPMRLQLMVEAKTEILSRIYQKQASIQQLVGNGWLLLSAKDPDSDDIQVFDPDTGWSHWHCPENITTPTVDSSAEWYQGKKFHLSPVLLEIPEKRKKGVNYA